MRAETAISARIAFGGLLRRALVATLVGSGLGEGGDFRQPPASGLGPNLIPLGYLPALTPFHHEAGEIGSSVMTSLRRTSLSALSILVKGLLFNLKSFHLVKLSNIIYLYKPFLKVLHF